MLHLQQKKAFFKKLPTKKKRESHELDLSHCELEVP